MTSGAMTRATAWSLTVSGAGAVLLGGFTPLAGGPGRPAPRPSTPVHAIARPYPAESLGRVAVGRDLFRLTRAPAPVRYDAARGAVPMESNAPPKPTLALVGLVVGGEPTAVIEGWPGLDGSRVVRVGDQVSGIRVAAIAPDHVKLVGMDTVWVLKVREPWKE
jgi:hypothetical protein